MRLCEMKDIIEKISPELIVTTRQDEKRSGDNKILFTISNYAYTYRAFLELKRIPILKGFITDSLEDQRMKIISNDFKLESSDHSFFVSIISSIKHHIDVLNSLLSSIVDDDFDKNILCLKLYDFKNFEEFSAFISNINRKFLSPLTVLNEEVKFSSFDKGSDWIYISTGSLLGFSILVHIVRASYDILINDYKKLQVYDEVIKTLNNNAEALKEMQKVQIIAHQEAYSSRANEVIESVRNDEKLTDDDKERIKNIDENQLHELENSIYKSLEEGAKQIRMGLEITQSFSVSEKDRYKLPSFTGILKLLGDDPQKMIEE